jgi:hypothetical protein
MQRLPEIAVMLVLLGGLTTWAAEEKKVADPKPISLKAIASDSTESEPGINTFRSPEELEKKFPKLLQQFNRAIDFKSEDLILVQWGSSGPPFGKLTYKSDKTSIIFTVLEPKAEIRGQAYKLGSDWYTVTKGTKIVMEK